LITRRSPTKAALFSRWLSSERYAGAATIRGQSALGWHPAAFQAQVRLMPRQYAGSADDLPPAQQLDTASECCSPRCCLNCLAFRPAECPPQRAHIRPRDSPGPYRPKPRKRPVPERRAVASSGRSAWRGRYPNPRASCFASCATRPLCDISLPPRARAN
jgi:hypothetical protein